MTEAEALKVLEKMSTGDFNKFLNSLPARVGMCVRSGMCDWRKVLPLWYIKENYGAHS